MKTTYNSNWKKLLRFTNMQEKLENKIVQLRIFPQYLDFRLQTIITIWVFWAFLMNFLHTIVSSQDCLNDLCRKDGFTSPSPWLVRRDPVDVIKYTRFWPFFRPGKNPHKLNPQHLKVISNQKSMSEGIPSLMQ